MDSGARSSSHIMPGRRRAVIKDDQGGVERRKDPAEEGCTRTHNIQCLQFALGAAHS